MNSKDLKETYREAVKTTPAPIEVIDYTNVTLTGVVIAIQTHTSIIALIQDSAGQVKIAFKVLDPETSPIPLTLREKVTLTGNPAFIGDEVGLICESVNSEMLMPDLSKKMEQESLDDCVIWISRLGCSYNVGKIIENLLSAQPTREIIVKCQLHLEEELSLIENKK